MRIILSPETKHITELRDVYNQAFDVAEELYIASAYLTDWDVNYKIGSACKRVVFLVGTDFGLTRKAAMRNVLRWVPRRISCFFGAVPQQSGGFHPKIVAWKARTGKHYCIIGSSNLSKAGFSTNYEANIRSEIVSHEFERLRKWLDEVAQSSHPVTPDWIKHHYTEAPLRKGNTAGKHLKPVIQIKPSDLPHGQACERTVRAHRKQQLAFRQIGEKIRAAARRCSQGRISSSNFWTIFWGLWSDHPSRLQGSGLQISGKAADWQEACGSLMRILDARRSSKSTVELDQIVSKEIDLGVRHRSGDCSGFFFWPSKPSVVIR